MPEEPKVWASLGATIRTGDYENQKIDIGVSGVPIDASDEQIALLMDQSILTIEKVLEGLGNKMAKIMSEDYGR